MKRNQSGGTGRVLFPSFFRFNPANGRGSGATRTRIAARNARGEARTSVLTLPPTRANAGGPEPAHHRGRVQPPQAHTQSLQPRRTAVPRVPGYLDSVQKRRLHHGTGAYPTRGGPGRARPFGRARRPSRFPARSARLAARARLRARARAGIPARVPAIPSSPTLRSGVNSPIRPQNSPEAGRRFQVSRLSWPCASVRRVSGFADRRFRGSFFGDHIWHEISPIFSLFAAESASPFGFSTVHDRGNGGETDGRVTGFLFFVFLFFLFRARVVRVDSVG